MSSINKYELIKVDETDQLWEELSACSINYTPFMREDYLNCVGYEGVRYIVIKTNRPLMGICLARNIKTGLIDSEAPFAPYQGFLYSENTGYNAYNSNLIATEYLLDYLYKSEGFKQIEFSNYYNVKDFRAVQWHHYHEREKGTYDIRLSYTGILKLSSFSRDKMSKGRKLDLRYSTDRYGIQCNYSDNIQDFLRLYMDTFMRENICLSDETVGMVRSIIDMAMVNDYGKMLVAYNTEGEAINATFVLTDKRRAYYIFGANDPVYRKCGGATLLLVNQMEMYRDETELEYFDFIGINSPQRGDFKLSFGADIVPYFICGIKY